jgi:hypothetical protein
MSKYQFTILLILILLLGCTNSKKETEDGNYIDSSGEYVITYDELVKTYGEYVKTYYYLETDYIQGLLPHNKIESLTIRNNDMLLDLNFFEKLSDFKNLEDLRIVNCNNIKDLEPIKYLQNLKQLWINDCNEIKDLEPLIHLQKLEFLLIETSNVIDILPIKYLQNLTYFDLTYEDKIENVEAIFESPKLKSVSLYNKSEYILRFDNIVNFSSNLEGLSIISKSGIDLKYIGLLQNTKSLSIYSKNINVLELKNYNLEQLDLTNGSDKKEYLDLNNLLQLSDLSYLSLYNYDIKDTSPLLKLQYLEWVAFRYTNFDPMPLLNSSSIKKIEYMLYGDANRRKDIPEEIFKEHGIEIIFDPDGK